MSSTIRSVIDRVDRAKMKASRTPEEHYDYINEVAAAYPHLRAEIERLQAIESRMRRGFDCRDFAEFAA